MSWDPVWEDIFASRPWGRYPAEPLIRFIARNFYAREPRSDVRILEVGCGPGANLWYLAREGFSAYGMDGSETAVRVAEGRLDSECPDWRKHGAQIVRGDISRIPWPSDFFDAVIDNECVYCNPFNASKSIYAEMARVVQPGGKLYSRTFATGSHGYETGEKVGHNAWVCSEGGLAGKGYSRFTALDEIRELVQGFELDNIELLTWTVDNRRHEIREWIITGEKRSPRP